MIHLFGRPWVKLWVEAIEERFLYLLPHTDVPLLDEDTGVVDRLGKSKLEHLRLSVSQISVIRLIRSMP